MQQPISVSGSCVTASAKAWNPIFLSRFNAIKVKTPTLEEIMHLLHWAPCSTTSFKDDDLYLNTTKCLNYLLDTELKARDTLAQLLDAATEQPVFQQHSQLNYQPGVSLDKLNALLQTALNGPVQLPEVATLNALLHKSLAWEKDLHKLNAKAHDDDMTGNLQEAQRLLQRGFQDLLLKPLSLYHLRTRIDRAKILQRKIQQILFIHLRIILILIIMQ